MGRRSELEQAGAELSALRADLSKLEALLEQHDAAYWEAKDSGMAPEELATVRMRRDAFESMLKQQRADVEKQERLVADLDAKVSEADRQAALREQATEYTRRFRAAQAQLKKVFREAEDAVFAAMTQYAYLERKQQEFPAKARSAAGQIKGPGISVPETGIG